MEVEDGSWTLYGLSRNDPRCFKTVDDAIEYINKIGFLPLFKNEIPGFSLEEWTASEDWWCDDVEHDPWMWRTVIARRKEIAYGKFFGKKAGFISKEWLPYFANYRRDGYDFDSLYEDGKAPMKHRNIMMNFLEDKADTEIFSNQLKQQSGFGKGGDKGFDGAIATLMMQLYLCNCDFRKRVNKAGEEYGWDVAVYATPEHLWGYSAVTARYSEEPKASLEAIVRHLKELYPETPEEVIRKVIK